MDNRYFGGFGGFSPASFGGRVNQYYGPAWHQPAPASYHPQFGAAQPSRFTDYARSHGNLFSDLAYFDATDRGVSGVIHGMKQLAPMAGWDTGHGRYNPLGLGDADLDTGEINNGRWNGQIPRWQGSEGY